MREEAYAMFSKASFRSGAAHSRAQYTLEIHDRSSAHAHTAACVLRPETHGPRTSEDTTHAHVPPCFALARRTSSSWPRAVAAPCSPSGREQDQDLPDCCTTGSATRTAYTRRKRGNSTARAPMKVWGRRMYKDQPRRRSTGDATLCRDRMPPHPHTETPLPAAGWRQVAAVTLLPTGAALRRHGLNSTRLRHCSAALPAHTHRPGRSRPPPWTCPSSDPS